MYLRNPRRDICGRLEQNKLGQRRKKMLRKTPQSLSFLGKETSVEIKAKRERSGDMEEDRRKEEKALGLAVNDR